MLKTFSNTSLIQSNGIILIDNDKENAPVYLEFDYKSNIDSVGLGLILTISGETQEVSLTNFKTIDNWDSWVK